eukprot:TRINITY_DN11100_c0_g1_i8.p2 TRINITY_DN11100_c0_g1~~TRINITY_DN11100_c0_g1_i8.p2  ORF type:complete len:280 (+),score=27.48 TRINITY_DN11100_c0_g1_i8:1751-2590(+)
MLSSALRNMYQDSEEINAYVKLEEFMDEEEDTVYYIALIACDPTGALSSYEGGVIYDTFACRDNYYSVDGRGCWQRICEFFIFCTLANKKVLDDHIAMQKETLILTLVETAKKILQRRVQITDNLRSKILSVRRRLFIVDTLNGGQEIHNVSTLMQSIFPESFMVHVKKLNALEKTISYPSLVKNSTSTSMDSNFASLTPSVRPLASLEVQRKYTEQLSFNKNSALVKQLQRVGGVSFHSPSEKSIKIIEVNKTQPNICLLYTSPSPRDGLLSRMPSSA